MTSEIGNGRSIVLRKMVFALALLFTKDQATSRSELAEKIRKFKWEAKIKITVIRRNGNSYSCPPLDDFIDQFNILGQLSQYGLVQINDRGEDYCLTIIAEALRESNLRTRKIVEETINMWVDMYDHRELLEKIVDEKIAK